jgi:hypothetical protein
MTQTLAVRGTADADLPWSTTDHFINSPVAFGTQAQLRKSKKVKKLVMGDQDKTVENASYICNMLEKWFLSCNIFANESKRS